MLLDGTFTIVFQSHNLRERYQIIKNNREKQREKKERTDAEEQRETPCDNLCSTAYEKGQMHFLGSLNFKTI